MAKSTGYDSMAGRTEHILALPENRQLAYAHNGPAASRIIGIYFPGLFAGVHWVSLTLPGMGNSSTRPKSVPYYITIVRDITALLVHLYPIDAYDTLYLAGGSYGTVAAQMLYGASYELFPPGRKVAGCVLNAGFSPLRYHTGYSKGLSWANYCSFGPPTQLIPFHSLQRLFKAVIGSKLHDVPGAKKFLYQVIFGKMDNDEKHLLKEYLETNRLTEDQFVEEMAECTVRCNNNWDGFMEVSDIIHSDWGFEPKALDKDHTSKPMLIVGSERDDIRGATNDWLVKNYKSAQLRLFPGGHISSMFHSDEIWKEMFSNK
ncbi:hypothetical protein TARUN_6179 [Trichoderma arundinaceum]|uniref:AB hydrolase-1 domain-containing protein n=1 Tax=Trichoderma arundinaceum TaxID=490622 RepID=A0A395NJH6_TRIAR|nr:hypothetical protein TARUN_6179 [Trichoderma arundinaceum]